MTWEITEEGASLARLALVIPNATQDVLELVLADATQTFYAQTNRESVPDSAEPLVRKLATLIYNRIGSEGLASESYSGVSQSFIDGFPADVKKELTSYRVVRFQS
jgi:hypothetical protein